MKRFLILSFFLSVLIHESSIYSQVPTNGLVAYYPFNGNANDESGNANNGTIHGNPVLTSDRFGSSAKAYYFDGVDDYIEINHSTSLNISQQISISFWAVLKTSADYYMPYHIIEKYDSWGIGQREKQFGLNLTLSDNTNIPIFTNDINFNTPIHLVVTFNGSNIYVYIDGALSYSAAESGILKTNINNILIGEYTMGGNYYFNGTLDDIRVYNRALNQTEINSLYHENGYAQVTDIDGNVYQTVTIGTQEWMKENLKTTKLNDGTAIPNITDDTQWLNLSTQAYCWYNNDIANKATYGALYNWYSVNTGKLCPVGWHAPGDDEWKQLEMYLGMSQTTADYMDWRGTNEGGKLKEAGLSHWQSPNTGATDESGFTGLPGGIRWTISFGNSIKANGSFWSSTQYNTSEAFVRGLYWDRSTICRLTDPKVYGFSVRCLKDAISGTTSITSFTPASGPIGTSVLISGTNFSTTPSENIVWFGSVKATVTAATSTQLTVTVPSGSTFQPISVTVNGLTAYSSNPFLPTFSSAQVITGTSFIAKTDFATGTSPIYVAVADFDTDGKPDIATVNQYSNSVSVFRNTSTSGIINSSSFSPRIDFTTGSAPVNIAASDIDGDGKQDIVVVNNISGTVSVFRNTSTSGSITSSSFSTKVDFLTSASPSGIAIADIDGDGKPDIVTSNMSSNNISVLRNTSVSGTIDGTSFAANVNFSSGNNAMQVVISDIDGDSKPEVINTNYDGNSISILRNTSTSGEINSGTFSSKIEIPTGTGPYSLAAGDLDGDGKNDIAVTNYNVNTISVFRNISTYGSITTSSFAAKIDYSVNRSEGVKITDLDGDAKPELVATDYTGSLVSILKNNCLSGTINFATKVDLATGTMPQGLEICDFDGDNKPDLLVSNSSSAASGLSIFRNNIATAALPAAPIIGAVTHPSCTIATGSVVLSGLPSNGTWTLTRSPGGTTTQGTGTSTTVTALPAGTYTYTVTDANSLTSLASASIVINAQPSTPSAPVPGTVTQPTCSVQTGSVQLTGLPSAGTWTLTRSTDNLTTQSSGTSTTLTGLPVGNYTYTVTNSAGCVSVASSSITINAAPGTPSTPTAGTIVQPTCNTPTGSIDIGGMPSSGTWTLTQISGGTSTGTGTHAPVQGLAPGTYSFTVTNESGCTSLPLTGVVINAVPTGNIPVIELKWNSVLVCYNLNNVFTAWQWYKDNSPVASSPGKAFYNTNKAGGMYKVQTTDKDGCKNFSNNIQVTGGSKGVLLYPNPANDKVTISLSDENTGDVVISLINSSGVKVLEDKSYKTGESLLREITVANLGYGIYTIKVTVNQKDISYNKLLISK